MKVIVLSSYAPTLLYFREDMMIKMVDNGHEVIAVAPEPEVEWLVDFSKIGVKYISISNLERTGMNPFKDILGLLSMFKVMKDEKPDKIFTYQAKTVIYGAIAAKLAGVKDVYAMMGGLGSIIRDRRRKVIKDVLKMEYKFAFNFCKKVFFQNNDDSKLMISEKIVRPEQIQMVNGSGVNLQKFKYKPITNFPVFLMIGRIIKDKGILEYIEAAQIVKSKYPIARIQLLGYFDTNPTSLKREEIQKYFDNGLIEYLGKTDNVIPFIERSTIYVLPSYHEGTPKSVLEAMAIGRPIITTDVPGCRETVVDGENGFLVQVRNSKELAKKMIWMIENEDKLEKMGQASFKICKDKFDVSKVNKVLLDTMKL